MRRKHLLRCGKKGGNDVSCSNNPCLYLIWNSSFSWVTNLYICIAQLENIPIKSFQQVATRIPGGAELLPAATGGDLDLHWICFSPRALFVPCMSYSRLMVAQSRSRTLSSSQRFGKIRPVFTPARRGGKAERTKAVRWFLWTVATLSSL